MGSFFFPNVRGSLCFPTPKIVLRPYSVRTSCNGYARCALSLRRTLKGSLKPCSGFACLLISKHAVDPYSVKGCFFCPIPCEHPGNGYARCALSLRRTLKESLKPCSGFACLLISKHAVDPCLVG